MAKIEVKDLSGVLLAGFNSEYASADLSESNIDAVIDAEISDEFNQIGYLDVTIPADSEKFQYFTTLNRIWCDNKEFYLTGPESVEYGQDNNGSRLAKIKAVETCQLLDRRFITLCNDDTAGPPRELEVIITTTGSTAGGFVAGSAGSALSHVLAGSGWSVGTVDVTGSREIKTYQASVLEIVKQIQELWGGWLIWDYVARTVSLRANTWEPYNGYQIHLGKNMKGIKVKYDYDAVSKMFVYGQNDIGIYDQNIVHSGACQGATAGTITLANTAVAVNDAYTEGFVKMTSGACSGQERRINGYTGASRQGALETDWSGGPPVAGDTYEIRGNFLLDYSYLTGETRTYVYRNQDLVNAAELKEKGLEVFEKLSAPRVTYEAEHVDLRSLSEYSHEIFAKGDMIDIINEELAIAAQIRVVGITYKVFRPWECSFKLGDQIYELENIISDLRKNAKVTYRIGRVSGTIVVGDGSTTKNCRRADFIVPPGSTDAQETINRAAEHIEGPKGKLVLLEGTFLCGRAQKDNNAGFVLPSGITLEGQGMGTVVKIKDGLNADIKLIQNSNLSAGNSDIIVKSLTLDGNLENIWLGIQDGVYFGQTTNGIIKDVLIKNFRGGGITLLANCYNTMLIANKVQGNGGAGIFVQLMDGITISQCVSQYNYQEGFFLNGAAGGWNIENCKAIGNGYYGFFSMGMNNCSFIGNQAMQNGNDGFIWRDCSNNLIASNQALENSQEMDNTYNGFLFCDKSSRNTIQANISRRGDGAKQQRYGLWISDSNCNGNMVTNNDLLDGGKTANFSDVGGHAEATVTGAGNRL